MLASSIFIKCCQVFPIKRAQNLRLNVQCLITPTSFRTVRLGNPLYLQRRLQAVKNTHLQKPKITPQQSPNSRILRQCVIMTVGGTSVSFLGAAIWNYETTRQYIVKRTQQYKQQNQDNWLTKAYGSISQKNPEAMKLYWAIVAVNVAVFLSWRLGIHRPIINAYFLCGPQSVAPGLSMLLSTFTHLNFFHLAINMYVMHSFSEVVIERLHKEQFSAFYISGGLFAALTSMMVKLSTGRVTPSVGASGAIMAMLGYTVMVFQGVSLYVPFVNEIFPHKFSGQHAAMGIVLFDLCGVIFKWRIFDHAAHLGGMMFGIWYAYFGNTLWHFMQQPVIVWDKIRGPIK